jgi:methylmalonyl-CoA mutase cobalamin-binding subunit
MKAVIRHLSSDAPVDVISNSLEDLGFNVINVGLTTATITSPD